MKRSIAAFLFGVVLLNSAYAIEKTDFIGKWKVIKEFDGSKVAGGYLEDIEFTPTQMTFNYKVYPEGISTLDFTVSKKFITAFNPKTKEKMVFDYKFIEGGVLYLHKEQWNWRIWLSKDLSQSRSIDPQDCKNISDTLRKFKEERKK